MLDALLEVEHLPWAGFGAVAGGVMFFTGFRHLRSARAVENTPTSRIRSLPLGSVEVVGTAHREEPLEGPLSGKPVAYYEVLVEEYRRSGRHSRWVKVHREASAEPFAVDDGTGCIPVLPGGADTHLPVDYRYEASSFEALPDQIELQLERWKLGRGLFGRRRMRFTERHLDLGAPVYVYGVAQERPDLRRLQAEHVNVRLRALRAEPSTMEELDVDGDGHLSPEEWERARERAVTEARAELVDERVVIARGQSGEMFLISDHPEKRLVQRLRLRAAGLVFGGAALAVSAAGYVIHSLGLWG